MVDTVLITSKTDVTFVFISPTRNDVLFVPGTLLEGAKARHVEKAISHIKNEWEEKDIEYLCMLNGHVQFVAVEDG